MNALSRKQREIASRHALFLEIARTVVHEDGFHQLSMERVAEQAEYSKGTVYQHFPCKEEMLLQLCVTSMTQLLSLFRRAAEFNGTHRERLHAIFFAHDLWANLEPRDACMIQHVSIDGFMEKVCDVSHQRHDELEQRITGTVSRIVQDALDAGDLKNPTLNPGEFVFALWSLSYGGQLLQSYNIPLAAMGVKDPGMALTHMLSACLDGHGWLPLSDEASISQMLERFRTELFAEEQQQLDLFTNNTRSAKGGCT